MWVLTNNKPSQVDVRIGITDGTNTEVASGLSAGQQVIVGTVGGTGAAASSSGGPPRRMF